MVARDEIRAAWTTLGRRYAAFRKAAGYTQHTLAPAVSYARSTIANVETGHQQPDRRFWTRSDTVLGTGGALVFEYDRITALARRRHRALAAAAPTTLVRIATAATSPTAPEAEPSEASVRQRVNLAVNAPDVGPATLEDWAATVATHGRMTRFMPGAQQLPLLLADIDDIQDLIRRSRHSASSLRQATVSIAQLAGLISLTQLKLNAFESSRRWGRTARITASEAADPVTSSWVWAQEAFRHFYAGETIEAITIGQHAQHLAGKRPTVGAALAAAVEGRAHAAAGNSTESRRALTVAEDILADLPPPETAASAFGYNEAQLRFHSGNAYTVLGHTRRAEVAHARALELYPTTDYLDRTLIHLDRAACRLADGDTAEGGRMITATLTKLPAHECDGLLVTRARAILDTVPTRQRAVAPVRDAEEALAICRSANKEPSA